MAGQVEVVDRTSKEIAYSGEAHNMFLDGVFAAINWTSGEKTIISLVNYDVRASRGVTLRTS